MASGVDDIAHGDRMPADGPKPPEVTWPAGLPASSNSGAPARTGWRPSGFRPTRFSAGPAAMIARSASAPMKRAGRADFLRDRPHQPGAGRVDVGGDVLAVQAEAGFEPQAVAGGEPDPHDAVVGEQLRDQRARIGFRQADLETVLAGIAGAAHEPVVPAARCRA